MRLTRRIVMSIIIEDLTHIYMPGLPYETKALDRINLRINSGEMVGLIGPTGCGKSTLIQHCNGLLKATSGRIQIDNLDLTQAKGKQLRILRQNVGLVFQFPEEQLFEETILDDIAFGPRNLGIHESEIGERVRWAMKVVGLNYDELKARSPFSLSGGQMRRVAIAGVLAMHPRILILDEPTAGLDPQGRDELLKQIRKLWRELKLTVILVSHHLTEVATHTDRIVAMHQGQIVLDGKPGQVFEKVDVLQKLGLGVPMVTDLLSTLNKQGWSLPVDLLTEEEAAVEIARQWFQRHP
jgi:energy-coupling factor transport system ATP-binding protein